MSQASFSERLDIARQMIARGDTDVAGHRQDQVQAATREARRVVDNTGAFLQTVQPGRSWRRRDEDQPPAEQKAYLAAAVLGCLPQMCSHLRKEGPQPAFARLPLERIECRRCVSTFRLPPTEHADRCDVCQEYGVRTFVPFAVASGPVLVSGDACPACAAVLGIGEEDSRPHTLPRFRRARVDVDPLDAA